VTLHLLLCGVLFSFCLSSDLSYLLVFLVLLLAFFPAGLDIFLHGIDFNLAFFCSSGFDSTFGYSF
jgi:hypothetical protein